MRKSKYNQEFKESVIKLCLDSDKSISSKNHTPENESPLFKITPLRMNLHFLNKI